MNGPSELSIRPADWLAYMQYRALPFQFYPLNNAIDVVLQTTQPSARLLPSRMRQVLECCKDFRTLEGHAFEAARISSSGRLDPQEQRPLLNELVRRKLLVSDEDLLKMEGSSEQKIHSLTSIAVISSGSPEMVRRALSSHMQNCRRHGRVVHGIVFDDSANRDALSACQSLVSEYRGELRYAGRREKAHYRDQLVYRGIPESVATFTLFGDQRVSACRTGANRNCSLLDTAGEMILSVDDDIVCRTARPNNPSSSLHITNDPYPRERATYVDRHAAIDSALWADVDLMGAHEDALGMELPALIALWRRKGQSVDIRSACDHQITDLYLNRGRICATMPGLVGESGEYSSPWLLRDAKRHRLDRSEEYCELALTSKEIVGISPTYALNHRGSFMAYSLGLDNRKLLPPFMPIFRSQDSVFGKLISSCFAETYWMHLPVGVLHDKVTSRPYCREADHVRVSELINALISRCSESRWTRPAGLNIEILGKSLEGLSQLPSVEFAREIDDCIRYELIQRIQYLGDAVSDGLDMSGWITDKLQRLRVSIQTKIEHSAFQLQDLDSSAGDRLEIVRHIIHSFAEVLTYWPTMAAISSELRSEGIRMSVPVH